MASRKETFLTLIDAFKRDMVIITEELNTAKAAVEELTIALNAANERVKDRTAELNSTNDQMNGIRAIVHQMEDAEIAEARRKEREL